MKLELKNIRKKYPKVLALNDINLTMEDGIYGLLGPNGAGKTTLMRILAGLIPSSKGDIYIEGEKVTDVKDIREMISYLPQEFSFYPRLSVYETLDYLGILANVVDKEERRNLVSRLLDEVNLTYCARKKAKDLSGGMKRRLGIAAALLKNPRILVVDEPSAGLDPRERIRLRNLLIEFSKERIVILSTHIVEDLAGTCEDIMVIDEGNIIFNNRIEHLLNQVKGKIWLMKVPYEQMKAIKEEYRVISVNPVNEMFQVRILSEEAIEAELAEPTLEDAYMYLMEGGGCE